VVRSLFSLVFVVNLACGPELYDSSSSAVRSGTPEGDAVLALVNDVQTNVDRLDAVLDRRAATGIVSRRPFRSIEALDQVPYVGAAALDALLELARAEGYLMENGPLTEAARARVILSVVNDANVTVEVLDDDVDLDVRAARAIVSARPIADLDALDALPYVGEQALEKILQYGLANGYEPGSIDVIFSPQGYRSSHNARIAQEIDRAQTSIDIAMYSFADEAIFHALERAVQRGVAVRLIYDTANQEHLLTGMALDGSSSARFERAGIDVRYVNKVMHHKVALIDRTMLITGSANWSYGAATRYDENTLFLGGERELLQRFQREFDHLWDHSRDLAVASFPFTHGAPVTVEDATDVGAYFTSANFTVTADTFRVKADSNELADQLVAAIASATDSILIASGHMRSRPVADALVAAKRARPNLDIRVYLDGQEFISDAYHAQQIAARDRCRTSAGSDPAALRACDDNGFYFGYQLDQSGIAVRYKYYAYRWDYSYAVQMHHKYMLIDGDELWTGSYNLSDNAEHNTFENMVVLRGGRFTDVVASYRANFESLWETSRSSNRYQTLLTEVRSANPIPLVFSPMALTWSEVTALKNEIRANCTSVDSQAFRSDPASHRTCTR
jgi:phosphatidylserine/phosphatidylglycerophosphate/cardiolipin synthase-like enzyme